jgi:hypothetical protein
LRPTSAPTLPPPPRDHQRRHHQYVERDRSLDAGHVRPDILGDGGNRDVHHRGVERHQELTRGEVTSTSVAPACAPDRFPDALAPSDIGRIILGAATRV